ncbi:hypothetical protein S7711_02149 [Stachybotrys chartarum IBT 7711]|uniref:N-acetyltransferase domain-containing protein n=1 Tax=Stachybotrys chartarum (strain CBS 109288 / IBT 7711) TaxID=1280523 RepID=A0A084ARL1_STACB|nr:hypothetical protein S7711_02149 [Stachybotrys chartarum IBT 7711]
MNILNNSASIAVQRQTFAARGNEPGYYTVVKIAVLPNGGHTAESLSLASGGLRDFVYATPPPQARAFLRLVVFTSKEGWTLDTSRETFEMVHSAFGLDEYGKFLICRRASACQQLSRRGSRVGFFLGLKSCKALYTYDVSTFVTQGIIIQDTPAGVNPLFSLPDKLCQAAHLAPHPFFIPCVCATTFMLFIREALREVLGGIVLLGKSRQVDVWAVDIASFDVQATEKLFDLSNMAILMGPMVGELEHIRRFLLIALHLRDVIQDKANIAVLEEVKHNETVCGTVQEMDELPRLVFHQLQTENEMTDYWIERGKNQMQTISSMITRGDVMASIQLAKLASRDSSSMKVVAVMTMAFLPATFFAALFSVPSLQWDSEEIVSSRFWIYWAFTLPCTALVFAAWLALTNRGGVRKALGAAWVLRNGVLEDAEEMTQVLNSAFEKRNTFNDRCFPPSDPAVIEWNNSLMRKNLADQTSHVIIVEEPGSPPDQPPRILGWSRWVRRAPVDPSVPRTIISPEEYPASGDRELAARFFQANVDASRRVMAGEGEYWFLSTIVVRDDAQRRKVGSTMMDWGIRRADEQGLVTYVNGSEEGKGLYERYGFRTVATSEVEADIKIWHMKREARPSVSQG